ncbi:MAG: alpha/beta fold hydrolase, partial [Clostridia bacterium]|nr:alpha/beta fold hydrolase [Clostridia bacterium]
MIRKPMFYIAIICMILSAALLILSFSYNNKFEKVSIRTDDGINLTGRLYTGTLDQCVVICHGFSSDFTNTYRLKSIFHEQGYGVLLFDFTGHGASGGTVTFDNAQTDRLSKDIENAVAFLTDNGYEPENIVLLGHSMGARSIMQYAVFNKNHGPLVLIGPEINLNENKQASFFTGAVDTEMPFVKSMSGTNPDAPILIITSDWDDISPIESSTLLYERLGGASSGRKLVIIPNALHNYEMVNAMVIRETLAWTNGFFGNTPSSSGPVLLITLYGWIAGLALALITPLLFYLSLKDSGKVIEENQVIIHTNKFILMKILMWLLGIVAGAVIVGVIFIIPMGKPLFSVQFIA